MHPHWLRSRLTNRVRGRRSHCCMERTSSRPSFFVSKSLISASRKFASVPLSVSSFLRNMRRPGMWTLLCRASTKPKSSISRTNSTSRPTMHPISGWRMPWALSSSRWTRSCGRPLKKSESTLLQRSVQQLEQLHIVPFSLCFVVDAGTAGNGPAVMRAFISFAFGAARPTLQQRLEFLDRLGRHAAIVDRMAEIESRLDLRQEQMWAVRPIRIKSATMEGRGGRDLVGCRGGGPDRHRAGEAITGGGHLRTLHVLLRQQKVRISRAVRAHLRAAEARAQFAHALHCALIAHL